MRTMHGGRETTRRGWEGPSHFCYLLNTVEFSRVEYSIAEKLQRVGVPLRSVMQRVGVPLGSDVRE